MSVSASELADVFAYLQEQGFHRTARLPLVAARQWSPAWEREAWTRFWQGLSNLQEVAWPRGYWWLAGAEERRLFSRLTLGMPDPAWKPPVELGPLFDAQGQLRFSVVSRFDRFILRSLPTDKSDDFVYFGDDTLFLMERSRGMLAEVQAAVAGPLRCLDLCCGGGGVGLSLPPFDGEVLGLDLNPLAIELAGCAARAQGLEKYSHECRDMALGLPGSFHLIFGNPPTLSPSLTGQDVFHATGTWQAFEQLLGSVLQALLPEGRAVFTLFSEWSQGRDEAWESLKILLAGKRGFRYGVRREFPLGAGRVLRHCVLELTPASEREQHFVPLDEKVFVLPGHGWRKG